MRLEKLVLVDCACHLSPRIASAISELADDALRPLPPKACIAVSRRTIDAITACIFAESCRVIDAITACIIAMSCRVVDAITLRI